VVAPHLIFTKEFINIRTSIMQILMNSLEVWFGFFSPLLKGIRVCRIAAELPDCKEYLMMLYDRYRVSTKSEKKHLLSEAVFFTQKSRKHIIRMLNDPKEALVKKKATGRPRLYPEELLQPHIRAIWIAMERISGSRMKAGLPD